MPTPEEYAADRLAARAVKYRTEVDRLRAAAGITPNDDNEEQG